MPAQKATTTCCQVFKENLASHSLLEIIHHEVGNGLAVIAGYTQLLRDINLTTAQDPESERREKSKLYLDIMVQRENHLIDFLTHIRNLAPVTPNNQNTLNTNSRRRITKTDLSAIVKHTINRLTPLYQHKEIIPQLPEFPIYAMGDPFWIAMAIEHVINHNIAFHVKSTPVHILLNTYSDPSHSLHEAQMSIETAQRQEKRDSVAEESMFEQWSQILDQKDQDVCMALCNEIINGHGGRLWTEGTAEHATRMFVSFPLVDQNTHKQPVKQSSI